MAKQRKVPLRKCLVTKELKPKEDLIRLVKTKENDILIDPSGKVNGRGAYLTYNKDIFLKAKEENMLAQAFKMKIEPDIYEDLLELISDQDE
ncbi:MAG TPA: YlxR family protein [Pseudogracilibacillus sp.]|nr:YlxR family protein [Pseudogracilibacillus sp.]